MRRPAAAWTTTTAAAEQEPDGGIDERRGQPPVAEHPTETAASLSAEAARARYGTTTPDAALVQGVRNGESSAYLEFFRRFAPLLRRDARRYGYRGAEREELVQDWLTDGALRVADYTRPVPQALAPYLVVGFRRRLHRLRQAADHEDACAHAVMTERADPPLPDDAATATAMQPRGRANDTRLANVGGLTAGATPPDTHWLANQLLARLSAADRTLLQWLGERAPQRDIAQWLGISHGAARVRATRLRARLRTLATKILDELPADARREYTELLYRAALPSKSRTANDDDDARPREDNTP